MIHRFVGSSIRRSRDRSGMRGAIERHVQRRAGTHQVISGLGRTTSLTLPAEWESIGNLASGGGLGVVSRMRVLPAILAFLAPSPLLASQAPLPDQHAGSAAGQLP